MASDDGNDWHLVSLSHAVTTVHQYRLMEAPMHRTFRILVDHGSRLARLEFQQEKTQPLPSIDLELYRRSRRRRMR